MEQAHSPPQAPGADSGPGGGRNYRLLWPRGASAGRPGRTLDLNVVLVRDVKQGVPDLGLHLHFLPVYVHKENWHAALWGCWGRAP